MGIVRTIVGVLPFVGGIVQSIESLFGHGNGATKKQAALTSIQAILGAYGGVTGANVANSNLVNDVGLLIDATVTVYNDLGIFVHAPSAAPTGGSK